MLPGISRTSPARTLSLSMVTPGKIVFSILFAESDENLNLFYNRGGIERQLTVTPLSERFLFPDTGDIFGVYSDLPSKIRNSCISTKP
jgi:hypothetical protein